MKEKTYDPFVKLQSLKASWVSQASARQRKGRAGRTRAGVCFHLYSKRRHENFLEFQDSELLRMPLEELVLQAKKLNLCPGKGEENDSIQAFLEKALDPPHLKSISNAIQLLQSINCLDNEENLTDIGDAISKLPMDPKMGRLIILGKVQYIQIYN
jgi:HrpA-like RNA helicase